MLPGVDFRNHGEWAVMTGATDGIGESVHSFHLEAHTNLTYYTLVNYIPTIEFLTRIPKNTPSTMCQEFQINAL